MTASQPREFESLADAAHRKDISVKTLRRRITSGDLPAYRNGKRLIRVRRSDVDALFSPMLTAAERASLRNGAA